MPLAKSLLLTAALTLTPLAPAQPKHAGGGMRVVADAAGHRVDVTFDGAPFTSYVWPDSLTKPVLYPLIAPGGVTVSRGYPLEPRPGERLDHPHHAGMWFNYGNVNGFDFWNNSTAIKPEDRPKMGSIGRVKIVSTRGGRDRGELVVESVWTTGKGEDLLAETTHYTFIHREGANVIDRVTTLRALDRAVFHDDKEGLLGIRVAHFLESADEKGGIFADASGRPTQVAAGDTAGASGVYLTSEGKSGAAAWGTRGRWCLLSGTTPAAGTPGAEEGIAPGQPITLAIFDHPANPGYPTYWHARGYGLFAANPLGDSVFDPKAPKHDFTLEKGAAATFRYRVAFYNHPVTPKEADAEAEAYKATPAGSLKSLTGKHIDLGADYNALEELIKHFFRDETAVWEVKVQLALAEDPTLEEKDKHFPIEKADTVWPEIEEKGKPGSLWQTVATITVVPQDTYSDARQLFVDEQLSFTPFHALAAHQPLGGIMRARFKAYQEAAKYRAQRNARTIAEPRSIDEVPA